jgi:endonuclease/exonuclease/phosphatase family metal-dependent hydrolase
LRLLSWNVARRVERLAEQAAAIASRAPDIVALQEVTARTWPLWGAALSAAGLEHVRCSLADADPLREPAGPRRHGVLLAAREPPALVERLPVPWPESTLGAAVGGVVVHTAHGPNAANGWI